LIALFAIIGGSYASAIILAVYYMSLSLFMIALDVVKFDCVYHYLKFLYTFLGRGITFVLLGVLGLGMSSYYNFGLVISFSILVIVIGLINVGLCFQKKVPFPLRNVTFSIAVTDHEEAVTFRSETDVMSERV
jgi:hypothetical protein